jgi:hypothetical protein
LHVRQIKVGDEKQAVAVMAVNYKRINLKNVEEVWGWLERD